MALDQALQPQRRVKLGPLRVQGGDGIALLANFGMKLHHALGANGGLHLDAIDIGRGEHQGADHEEVDEPHGQPPPITLASVGHAGHSGAACVGASVRSAARSLAERARGLADISASSGVTGRLVKIVKLGAAFAVSGRCRDPPPALPRSPKKFLTMRSSREWNDTTTSRPPGFNTRSASESARCSSSSSWLTKIRR